MGLLDEAMKMAGGALLGGKEQGQGGLMESVLGLLNNPETGGLAGLIETFKGKGLGDAVSSWISTGENQPVSGDQIQNVLGSGQIQQIAEKLGVSTTEASGGLASLLPMVIDKLTPQGTLPEGGLLEQGLGMLMQKLRGS
jgi:uncharacterized protein YidB (DUF937 family)